MNLSLGKILLRGEHRQLPIFDCRFEASTVEETQWIFTATNTRVLQVDARGIVSMEFEASWTNSEQSRLYRQI